MCADAVVDTGEPSVVPVVLSAPTPLRASHLAALACVRPLGGQVTAYEAVEPSAPRRRQVVSHRPDEPDSQRAQQVLVAFLFPQCVLGGAAVLRSPVLDPPV